MTNNDLNRVFDRQAASYDARWVRLAPITDALYFLLDQAFSSVPLNARVLCVGVGTGAEVIRLASRFPGWQFMAVEPSRQMFDMCRQRVEDAGLSDRCLFHHGYVETLPTGEIYDAATSFLVSQFILNPTARIGFFHQIKALLVPGGMLASTDLSADQNALTYDTLLALWQNVMSPTDAVPQGLARMKAAYATDVGVLLPSEVAGMITAAGFDRVTQFFQAGLICGWIARKSAV